MEAGMISILLFQGADYSAVPDGNYHAITKLNAFGGCWRFATVAIDKGRVASTTFTEFPPDEVYFRTMMSEVAEAKIQKVYAHADMVSEFEKLPERMFENIELCNAHIKSTVILPYQILQLLF